jgi:hypothetical protein
LRAAGELCSCLDQLSDRIDVMITAQPDITLMQIWEHLIDDHADTPQSAHTSPAREIQHDAPDVGPIRNGSVRVVPEAVAPSRGSVQVELRGSELFQPI